MKLLSLGRVQLRLLFLLGLNVFALLRICVGECYHIRVILKVVLFGRMHELHDPYLVLHKNAVHDACLFDHHHHCPLLRVRSSDMAQFHVRLGLQLLLLNDNSLDLISALENVAFFLHHQPRQIFVFLQLCHYCWNFCRILVTQVVRLLLNIDELAGKRHCSFHVLGVFCGRPSDALSILPAVFLLEVADSFFEQFFFTGHEGFVAVLVDHAAQLHEGLWLNSSMHCRREGTFLV